MHGQSETFGLFSALIRHLLEILLQQGCRQKRPCCGGVSETKTQDEHVVKSKPNNFLPSVMLLLALMLAMAIDSRDSEANPMASARSSAGVNLQ